jgi:hypothetical protein
MMADISAKCECNMLHVPGSVRVSAYLTSRRRGHAAPGPLPFFVYVILVLEACCAARSCRNRERTRHSAERPARNAIKFDMFR